MSFFIIFEFKKPLENMKRFLLYVAAFVILIWVASSCSDSNDCQFCKIVERTSGGTIVNSGSETEYCGSDLDNYKSSNPDVTDPVTGNVTRVECR